MDPQVGDDIGFGQPGVPVNAAAAVAAAEAAQIAGFWRGGRDRGGRRSSRAPVSWPGAVVAVGAPRRRRRRAGESVDGDRRTDGRRLTQRSRQ